MTRCRMVRGSRKPVVIDLMIGTAVASLLAAGVRSVLARGLDPEEFLVAASAMFGIQVVAALYGVASVVEMRRGWLGASLVSGLLHLALVLVSMAGIAALAVLDLTAASLTIVAEGALLLWSSSWL